MGSPKSNRSRELAADVLNYFLTNPRAADSLEGMLRWRLNEVAVRRASSEVVEVLDWLVEQGYLLEHITRGSGRNYCLNFERQAEADRALAELLRRVASAEE